MVLTGTTRMGDLDHPIYQMRRMQSDMNRLFDGLGADSANRISPAVNMWISDESAVMTAELPGLSRDDITLTIREDTLSIEGERKWSNEDNQVMWHSRECEVGSFSRTVQLPFEVDPEKVQARFRHGVLEVEMQRPEEKRPRRIEIKSS